MGACAPCSHTNLVSGVNLELGLKCRIPIYQPKREVAPITIIRLRARLTNRIDCEAGSPVKASIELSEYKGSS